MKWRGSKLRLHPASPGDAPAAGSLECDEHRRPREGDAGGAGMRPREHCGDTEDQGQDAADDAAFGVDVRAEERHCFDG